MKRIVQIAEQLAEEIRAAQREEQALKGDGEASKTIPNCLIVEDNPHDAELAARALRSMGAEVRVAISGDQAIEILNQSANAVVPDFHIVFLDLNLTGSAAQGMQVLRHIRGQFPKLHVVIISGYIDEGLLNYISRSDKAGGYIGVISKPLDEMNVQEILEKHRLQ